MSASSPAAEISPDKLPEHLVSLKLRFERCKARFDTAAARIELAKQLAAKGWSELATREANAALEILAALGAETSEPDRQSQRESPGGPDMELLTAREQQVLSLLAEGLTNRQIGMRLKVSEHTAHHHVAHILQKLQLPSRAAAAAAYAAGMAEPGRAT